MTVCPYRMGWCSLSLSASVISLCLDTQTEELVDSPKSLDELVVFFFFKKKKKNVAIRHSASLLLDEVWQKEPSSKSQTSIFFLADIGAMQIFSRSQSFKSNKWRNNTVIVIKSCCFCSNFILSCQILIDFMLQQKRNQILHILILANRYNYYYQTYLCLHHSSCWSPHPLRHRPL